MAVNLELRPLTFGPRRLVPWRFAAFAVFLALMIASTGCTDVSLKKFSATTHVDAWANPSWQEHANPFQTQFARLRARRAAACSDPAVTARIHEIIGQYEEDWKSYWAASPKSPPVVLTFHSGDQWLGTLDLYESRLGHVGNLLHDIEPEEAVEILRLICDCAETGSE